MNTIATTLYSAGYRGDMFVPCDTPLPNSKKGFSIQTTIFQPAHKKSLEIGKTIGFYFPTWNRMHFGILLVF